MTPTTQQAIRDKYAIAGEDYDAIRVKDPRGRLLSSFDVELVRRMVRDVPREAKTLEAGAGTGRFTLPMIESGFQPVATDINESLLDTLRERLEAEGLGERCTVQPENVFALSFPDATFDFIYSLHVIPRLLCFDDQERAIIELARVLKPAGRLLFNYWNRSSLLGRLTKDYVTPAAEMDHLLQRAGLRTADRCGKAVLSRSVLRRLPLTGGRLLAAAEKPLAGVLANRKWDIFVLAEKSQIS